MTGHDEEFDDFLARRRKLFRAVEQDPLEPPEEVDRVVLHQAREAIQVRSGPREIRGISWGVPLALAATLLLAFTVVLVVGNPKKSAAPVPQVTVETVAQHMEYPTPANNPAPPAPAPAAAPVWRRDSKSWLAEIQRLRAAGENAEADAEFAEYKRQHRAYAASPDH